MKSDWITCKLEDIGTIVGGATPSTKDESNYGGNIAWITPKDLSDFKGRYIEHGERNITEKGLKSCSTQMMPKNTILFSSRAPIGYVAIAKNEMCTNQGFKSVIPNEDVDPLFVYYLLKYNKCNIENLGSGTTFKEVSGTTMKGVEVTIPRKLEEQRKIALVLNSLDEKIELNEEINKNLQELATTIFKNWFIDLTPFSGVVPDTWQHSTLGEECRCELGGTPSRTKSEYWGGNIPWINSGEVNLFRITKPSEYITELGLNKSATKLLPAKTTVIAITGATLGQISLLEIDSCANQSVVGVVPTTKLPYEFVYAFIQANINELISHQTGGAQQHINKQNVESLPLFIPDSETMGSYVSTVHGIYETIANNCFEIETLSALRDSLLPQLMSGTLSVSDIVI